MIRNYLVITLRNVLKYKSYSFTNILGLSIGIACCLMILLYIQDEMSYDKYHENADRIYRVTREFLNPDGTTNLHLGPVAPPFGPLLKTDFPEIEHLIRFYPWDNPLLNYEDKYFLEDNFFYAEPEVFDIFSFKMLKGDPKTALVEPNTIVMTESMEKKYFGDEDGLGKTIQYKNQLGMSTSFKVTGVIEDVPRNSHFTFDFLASFITFERFAGQSELQSWGSNNFPTYFLLPEGTDPAELEARFPEFLDRHLPISRGLQPHEWTRLNIQKLTDIHLYSHLDSEIEPNSDIVYVRIYSAVALLILIIACINFMNLSTARSAQRAKEVGMRKVVGATRFQIARQFLGESLSFSLVSMLFAVLLVAICLPFINDFIGKQISFTSGSNTWIMAGILGITLFVGVVSGSYPAFFLSRFKPVSVLQGNKSMGSEHSLFRSALVVFQFSISVVLIISMSIVNNQLDFVRNKELGFNKELVVVLSSNAAIIQNLESVKNRLKQYKNITNVSAAKRVPSGRLLDSSGARIYIDAVRTPLDFRVAMLLVDHDYFDTYEMEIVAGRNFSKLISSDSTEAFVLNETAVKEIGWSSPQDAIDQRFYYWGRDGRIIGVVKDFHFESLHNEIAPMVFLISPTLLTSISVRIAAQDIEGTMDYLKDVWEEYRPNYPFGYYFVDENFDLQYENEEKLGKIFGIFSGLAIFIACLGLMGLAAYTAEQRTKEIGIRKVLGASSSSIVLMISRDFAKLVVIANIIGGTLAYFLMGNWLQQFAYRISIDYSFFLIAAAASIVVALLSVGYQAAKASFTNPVDSLRFQ